MILTKDQVIESISQQIPDLDRDLIKDFILQEQNKSWKTAKQIRSAVFRFYKWIGDISVLDVDYKVIDKVLAIINHLPVKYVTKKALKSRINSYLEYCIYTLTRQGYKLANQMPSARVFDFDYDAEDSFTDEDDNEDEGEMIPDE